MKKRISNVLSLMLAAIICFTGVVTLSATEAAAASKTGKLSAKSVTIAMGGAQKIKLKSGGGKWRIKGNGVARISKKTEKYAKVVPIRAGKTILYCKTGGKTYKCKISVLNDSVGSVNDMVNITERIDYPMVVGMSQSFSASSSAITSDTKATAAYDTSMADVRIEYSQDPGNPEIIFYVTARKAGRFTLNINYSNGGSDMLRFTFINGFRGKTKCKKTEANYNKWRKNVISSMVSRDMTTWEIIDALGTLISSGKYGLKGGATGIQLWYGGNGTCVSGAKMMKDFMDDLGVKSEIHFMGNKGGSKDIYDFFVMYASQHKNIWVTLGGQRYEINPQPGAMWPAGTVRR